MPCRRPVEHSAIAGAFLSVIVSLCVQTFFQSSSSNAYFSVTDCSHRPTSPLLYTMLANATPHHTVCNVAWYMQQHTHSACTSSHFDHRLCTDLSTREEHTPDGHLFCEDDGEEKLADSGMTEEAMLVAEEETVRG